VLVSQGGNKMLMKRMLIAMSVFALCPGMHWNAYAAPAQGKAMSVTGCLVKGDEPNEFSITGANGKTYGLRSSSVNLSEHVGHKLTVKGTVKKEGDEDEKNEAEEQEKNERKSGSKETADLNVTAVKMISNTCK